MILRSDGQGISSLLHSLLRLWMGCWLLVLLGSCSPGGERIGVMLELDGPGADLGQSCRDGIALAADDYQARTGKKLALDIRDIGSDTGKAREVFLNMYNEGIRFFIGTYTSRQALAIHDLVQAKDVVFMSPTASSTQLSGLKDHFYRIISSNEEMARFLALRIIQSGKGNHVAVFQDTDNSPYSVPYSLAISQEIQKTGGLCRIISFSSSSRPDYAGLVAGLAASGPQSVVCVSNGADAGFIAQHVRKLGLDSALWACAWSMSGELLRIGGKAAENMCFVIPVDLDSPQPEFQHFAQDFQSRFATRPTFAAVLSYESLMVMADWIGRYGLEPSRVEQGLLGSYEFKGLAGMIRIDPQGDASRQLAVFKVAQGQFVRSSPGVAEPEEAAGEGY